MNVAKNTTNINTKVAEMKNKKDKTKRTVINTFMGEANVSMVQRKPI